MRVATGLDRIAAGDEDVLRLLRGRKLGLLAHPASVNADLRHARDVLINAGCTIHALFGPEHGYGGEAQDMIGVTAAHDLETGAPIHSLYGAWPENLSPRPEWLEGLDAVVIDLQDVGARYYTFVWTAALMLRAAARAGVHTIVLDRPNPLGGDVVEGAPQRGGYRSFVGLYDVAVRHGLTIGEICERVRRIEGLDESTLTVVRMHGYQRSMLWADTRLPWVLPSPNMPTPETALVYPGGCLIEGTLLSEGRGTTRPFEIWGAPYVDGKRLARDVTTREVTASGVTLRPLTFTPTFHKHAGQLCGGVQVHVTDAAQARTYTLYARLIAAVRQQAGAAMAWRTEEYEYEKTRPAIDLLTGGPELRQLIDRDSSLDGWVADQDAGAQRFKHERAIDLLYRDTH